MLILVEQEVNLLMGINMFSKDSKIHSLETTIME